MDITLRECDRDTCIAKAFVKHMPDVAFHYTVVHIRSNFNPEVNCKDQK